MRSKSSLPSLNNFANNWSSWNATSVSPKESASFKSIEASSQMLDKSDVNIRSTGFKSKIVDFDSMIL